MRRAIIWALSPDPLLMPLCLFIRTATVFIQFLCDVVSPYEVKDYIHDTFGDSMAARDFGDAFLKKRLQYSSAGGGGAAASSPVATKSPPSFSSDNLGPVRTF